MFAWLFPGRNAHCSSAEIKAAIDKQTSKYQVAMIVSQDVIVQHRAALRHVPPPQPKKFEDPRTIEVAAAFLRREQRRIKSLIQPKLCQELTGKFSASLNCPEDREILLEKLEIIDAAREHINKLFLKSLTK